MLGAGTKNVFPVDTSNPNPALLTQVNLGGRWPEKDNGFHVSRKRTLGSS